MNNNTDQHLDLDSIFSATIEKSGDVTVEGTDGTRFTVTSSGSLSIDPSTFLIDAFDLVRRKVVEHTLPYKKAS